MHVRGRGPALFSFTLCLLSSVLLGSIANAELISYPNLAYFQFGAAGILCGAFVVPANTFGTTSVSFVGS